MAVGVAITGKPDTMKNAALTVVLLLAACSGEEAAREPAASDAPQAVRIAQVSMQTLSGSVTVSGTIEPREEAAVGAELAGYRVSRVLAEEGDRVSRGQALATLDPALLGGEIARAEVAAERARSEYARVADLTGKGVIADETIAQRRFEARSADVQLADLRTRRARLTLRAPVAGLVLSRALRPGDISGAGSTDPYFRIARDARFELVAEVPEAEFGRITLGQNVPVRLADGTEFLGTVRLIAPRVDPQTKLGRVRILLPRDMRLREGGFATADLGRGGAPVSAVPERAVLYRAGGAVVTTIGSDRRVRQVEVRTGGRGRGWVELRRGPPVGTRIVLDGGALLLPGDEVRIAGSAAR